LIYVKDKWFRILIVLIPILLVVYISGLSANINTAKIIRVLVSLYAIILVTGGSRYLVYSSRRWFAGRWRLLYVFIIGTAGQGLYSINARYQMLNNPGLVIEKNEKVFSVSVSLINALK
jgi:hypothetical protein